MKFGEYISERGLTPGEEGERASRIEINRNKRKEEKVTKKIKGKVKAEKKKVCESEENSNIDLLFEAGMTVAEIAKKEGISRQIVHRQLKSAAGKMYKAFKESSDDSPFKVLLSMAVALHIENQEDLNSLKQMLPKDIITEIEADAKNFIRNK
jgi:predicted DNA-binding protein (UPF0251 family)